MRAGVTVATMKNLETVAKHLYCRTLGIVSRSEHPYATHLPVLVGVASAFQPQMVLEFGSGDFSTLTFLDKVAFPSVLRVDSYENNLEWLQHLQTKLADNPRVACHYFDGRMKDVVSGDIVEAADLIFIDDSPTGWERAHTVKKVARICSERQLTIVHDYDLPGIRVACRKFEHRFSFTSFTPQCCAVWNGDPQRKTLLEGVALRLQENAAHLDVVDARGWAKVFCPNSQIDSIRAIPSEI